MFSPHLSSQDQRDKRKLGSAKGFLHSGFGLQWPESQRRYAKAGKGLVIPIESNNSNFGPLRSFSLRHPAVKSFLAKFGYVQAIKLLYSHFMALQSHVHSKHSLIRMSRHDAHQLRGVTESPPSPIDCSARIGKRHAWIRMRHYESYDTNLNWVPT